jgi:NAD+ diphosphatase
VAAAMTDRDAGVFVEAVAIANWHAVHTHCPRCGSPTTVTHSGWVRRCPRDGSEHFPRTDPAIIVTVVDRQDRLLLGNNIAWGPHRYSTLAGFVEPGESVEAAVVREVHEESNLVVHSPEYLGSQPWPFPQSLMLGYTATTDHPEAADADREEVAHVRWFTRDELAAAVASGDITIPGSSSISRALIEHWFGGPLPEPRTLQN